MELRHPALNRLTCWSRDHVSLAFRSEGRITGESDAALYAGKTGYEAYAAVTKRYGRALATTL